MMHWLSIYNLGLYCYVPCCVHPRGKWPRLLPRHLKSLQPYMLEPLPRPTLAFKSMPCFLYMERIWIGDVGWLKVNLRHVIGHSNFLANGALFRSARDFLPVFFTSCNIAWIICSLPSWKAIATMITMWVASLNHNMKVASLVVLVGGWKEHLKLVYYHPYCVVKPNNRSFASIICFWAT